MKTRYKFLYRSNNLYFWQATTPVSPVDSRVEEVYCNAEWFWSKGPKYAQISGRSYYYPRKEGKK